ncbi:MAG: RagB/SusD family nutrient uptake outer membrane protein [Bacteroidetes bacterium]|nr:RagB/SusD family nutrient uptake outer membrane protein [Bacteroidota bacterium]
MKRIIYIILIFSIGMFFNSCDEDFLDKTPQDEISEPDFWKTEGDLQLYLNGLYGVFPQWGGSGAAPSKDLGTDIVIESQEWWGDSFTPVMDGVLTVPTSGGGWSWGDVRRVNYFLENAVKAETGDLIEHYIGEGYFLRAWIYFELLKGFGDLPIVTEVLNVDDEAALYGSRSPRSEVVDFILEDIDMAISKMGVASEAGPGRLNQDVAILFKARVCLYEGTWEKYHEGTVFAGSTNGTALIEEAVTAAMEVISRGNYSLTTGDPDQVYYDLFVNLDLSDNPEVLLWKQYRAASLTESSGNSMWNHPNTQGMTHGMTENYLCSDGLPYAVSPLFVGDDSLTVIEIGRDARFKNTVMVPGDLDYVSLAGDTVLFTVPYMVRCPTGYALQKWRENVLQPETNGRSGYVPYIYFRYAEALLIYAEAKAELGTLSQGDVDISINEIRERVGMPDLVLGDITVDPNWPDYGYALPDYLLEIRRERVVELFAEGYRIDDLMRWRAHELFVGTRPTGTMYTSDIQALYPNEKVNEDGFIDPFVDYLNGGAYGFNPERDYLWPLPTNELTINPNLDQNPNW